MKAFSRFFWGIAGIAFVLLGLHWYAERLKPPPPPYTAVTISPVYIGELIKELKLETGSRNFMVKFELTHRKSFGFLWWDNVASVPFEWGSYTATGKASVGFQDGAIHVLKLEPNLVEFSFDAPKLLHLETGVTVDTHSSVWSNIHFQEVSNTKAKQMLTEEVCKSTLLADANVSVKEKLPELIHKDRPDVQVVIHTTEPTAC